jgi:uncharacterized protein (TIGR00369 family)
MPNHVLALLKDQLNQPMRQSPSPLARWLQGILRQADEGQIAIEFTVREEMTNPMGILHGGAMAAIIDDVIGTATFSLGQENFYTSVNLVIDFLASARQGEAITARTRIIRAGKTMVNVECEVTNESGKLLARGTSNLLYTHIKVSQ